MSSEPTEVVPVEPLEPQADESLADLTTPPAIEVRQLRKHYGELAAVRGVDVSVASARTLASLARTAPAGRPPSPCPSEEVHPPSGRNSELIPNNAWEAPSSLRAKQMMA